MLEAETKKRIDTARDILVGKVPDPKSQVEQITIALIYKFMDDMDRESQEMGGKASFFTGEYKRYRWSKIVDPRLGGHEMLNLYAEAIVKLNQNSAIPQLFRDIFKNAYLPYRDPETLKLFLRTINEFEYDHSENLGDAFEYLLSVLGSQGDAGQFRTPRNIIDFMVEVIDPQKSDIIIDPACGTAGFLISSFKHIMKANTKKVLGDLLTTAERKKLFSNFMGYDISPDMVRLSLANLYLHGFKQPKVYEYDTLTSDERWNEYADVILANPPFMSPKGGIKPHKKFSVQSNRSEVLFVDYIAEHLRPLGRAAVIVPEGIIFQSGTAYKQLRKTLVEKYLFAVVSLPAGVFNPYAGVKTSILFLDPSFAKKSDSILFVKIENDGFSLGAQRRAIESNDLPDAVVAVKEFKKKKLTQRRSGAADKVLIVAKEKIAESGDYNLSGERYRENKVQTKNYDWYKIKELIETITPPEKIQKTLFQTSGRFPIIDQSQEAIAGWTNDESSVIHPIKPLVIFGDHTCAVKLVESSFAQGADGIKILKTNDLLEPKYLYHILRIKPLSSSGYQRHFSLLKEYKIPLPTIEVQWEIVAEIEGYQKIIDGARQVVENWKPHIEIDPDWPLVKLGEVCDDFKNGLNFSAEQVGKGTKFVNIKDVFSDGYIDTNNLEKVDVSKKEIKSKLVNTDDLLFVRSSVKYEGAGFPSLIKIGNEEIVFCGFLIKCTPNKEMVIPEYLLYLLRTDEYRKKTIALSNKANITNISQENIKSLEIPIPPLEKQREITKMITEEKKYVDGCRELVVLYEEKIKKVVEGVWG